MQAGDQVLLYIFFQFRFSHPRCSHLIVSCRYFHLRLCIRNFTRFPPALRLALQAAPPRTCMHACCHGIVRPPPWEPAPGCHEILRPPPREPARRRHCSLRPPIPLFGCSLVHHPPLLSCAPQHHLLHGRSMPPLRPSSHLKMPPSPEPWTSMLCRRRCCRGRSRC